MKNYTVLIILFISTNINIASARVSPDDDEGTTSRKVCLVHGKLYQVVQSYGQCQTNNVFYDIIENNYDNNYYDFPRFNDYDLRQYNIAPDPRINPSFYHGNYEEKALIPHDPDCFSSEQIN